MGMSFRAFPTKNYQVVRKDSYSEFVHEYRSLVSLHGMRRMHTWI